NKTTQQRFQNGNQKLWNSKYRFGNPLTALEVVKELDIARTLILTHRPVVNSGWYDDFGKIFYDREDYIYGSQKGRKPGTSPDKHFAAYAKEYKDNGTHIVWFASLQDLRGSKDVGGGYDKNHYLFAMDWDLLIIDEAHEGTKTELGGAVIEMLSKENTKVLRLSGTPYNIIDGYSAEEIYTWDYTMEQRAKLAWDEEHLGEHNPYASLPRMNIYTYDLGRLITQYDEGEIAFNFHEFFLTDAGGGFVHHADVKRFLDLLVLPDETGAYPFSNERYRSIFRHTLWVLPGVKAARALDVMLRHHPVFGCFEIVNVAGESRNSEGEERGDALERVTKAIGGDACATRTITLTCGRLTTGVTVGAWTGVLMLAGGYNTSLASYMQTIFRVQSSCEFGGKTKEDCYVFDFAPDRTLRVIADAAKANTKAGKTTDTQRAELGKLLNFCPVIAIKGSGMTELKADELLRRVKRAYIERVVRSGFEDGYLYNDELLKLSDIEIKEFANLKGIIGQTKAIGSSGDIDINRQGLTNEEYEELERISKKKKSELTEEEKKRKEEHRQKQQLRKEAISILRGISIRMPLLIYGADIADEEAELTIDNFTSLVDDSSWEEFMPAGVSKDYFKQFLKYYDADIFSAAGKRIRALAREADKMSIEERIQRITEIFSLFRNPDKETVLTPWRVVNMHLADALGGYAFYDKEYAQTIDDPRYVDRGRISDEVFAPNSAVLEINSKSGLYPLYMTYTIYRRRIKDLTTAPVTHEDHLRIWDETLRENIFVVCKTPMAKSITRRTLAGFRTEAKVNMHYFEDLINQIKNKQDAFLAKVKQGKTYWKANDNNDMKFSVVVGNP
ncbi:MAG: DEAD/DEAH box helicase family protein, partial [Prevotella sp.]|nr:DEAD/DEAH box helicase family protein [Prevotella sp.]